MVKQTLDARYIDSAALLRLLEKLFGKGNFKIDVSPCVFYPLLWYHR